MARAPAEEDGKCERSTSNVQRSTWPRGGRGNILNFVLQRVSLRGKACRMIDRVAAEEHLRVIRSLMEKATIYRTISAEGALVGGALSLITAIGGVWLANASWAVPHRWCLFELPWAAVFILTAAVNLF